MEMKFEMPWSVYVPLIGVEVDYHHCVECFCERFKCSEQDIVVKEIDFPEGVGSLLIQKFRGFVPNVK